jgi:hypothetical protein
LYLGLKDNNNKEVFELTRLKQDPNAT